MSNPLDDPTVTSIVASPSGAGSRRRPVLTVLWHADPTRVGETSVLTQITGISRTAPIFTAGADGTGPGEPLADPCMSRGPAFTIVPGDSSVDLRAGEGKSVVQVDGVALEGVRSVPLSQLETGVVFSIGGRLALCLHLADDPATRGPDLGLVGRSDAMEDVRRQVLRVGPTDLPVLVRGETGTGKELVVRALVAQSPRKVAPYVPLNMGGLPTSTAAAELFGHERGAFTGAADARPGYFAQAHGGTIFFDELGNTPAEVQKMLLRAVESGEILPLGSTGKPRVVDVRIIAATDADLETDMRAGRFSLALFERLARTEIRLPPLRQRRVDIGLLLLHFLRKALDAAGESHRLSPRGTARPWLSADLVTRLALHAWPGNVRSLRNVANKIVQASRGQKYAVFDKTVEALLDGPDRSHSQPGLESPGPRHSVPAFEPTGSPPTVPALEPKISESDFLAAMSSHRWVPAAAARALRVSRQTVYNLIERSGLRTAEAIPGEEILRCIEACRGDKRRAAAQLRISPYALTARLTHLDADPKNRAPR